MELKKESLISRNTGILANQVGNEIVMMDMEKGKYFGTNRTGSYIWQVLETPMTFASLCSRLAADFNITEEKCMEEVSVFLQQMQNEGIIGIQ